jgi:hypothetical protein
MREKGKEKIINVRRGESVGGGEGMIWEGNRDLENREDMGLRG